MKKKKKKQQHVELEEFNADKNGPCIVVGHIERPACQKKLFPPPWFEMPLPKGVENKYWWWNKRHSLDNLKRYLSKIGKKYIK